MEIAPFVNKPASELDPEIGRTELALLEPLPQEELARYEKECVKGLVGVAHRYPFFGHIIQQVEKIWVNDSKKCGTFAVGRRKGDQFIKLFGNLALTKMLIEDYEAMFSKACQPRKYVESLLVHEVIHISVGHLFLDLPDKKRANYAMDIFVNQMISGDSDKSVKILPQWTITAQTFDLPLGKSTLWYYKALEKNEKYKKQSQQEGDETSHEGWSEISGDTVAESFVKDIVGRAKQSSEQAGTFGSEYGGLLEEIEGFLERKPSIVPWNRVVRMFVASRIASTVSYTKKKISRRFGTRPGTRKGEELSLAVAIDTSGSVGSADLLMFWNEIRWIWRNGATVDVWEIDTSISERSPITFNGKWDGTVSGRGGTSLEPIMEACEGKYDGLILFTDGECSDFQKEYRIRTLIVLTEGKFNRPYSKARYVNVGDGVSKD